VRIRLCGDCGAEFEDSQQPGRPPTYCPACRGKVRPPVRTCRCGCGETFTGAGKRQVFVPGHQHRDPEKRARVVALLASRSAT
jgi:hypothetical protein